MGKIIFIIVATVIFSGCVGTLVQNEAVNKTDTRVSKGLKNELNIDKKVINHQ